MTVAVAWSVAAGAADAVDVTRLAEAERAWIDAGGHVFVVTGARTEQGQNPVPADVCDRLSRIRGVDASFALVRSDATGSLSHLPGGRASIYSVSAGAGAFLGIAPAVNGVVIGTSGFAARSGAHDGDTVRVAQQASPSSPEAESAPLTLRVADATSLGDEYDGALLIPGLLTDKADACYVRTDAAHRAAVEAALPSYLAHNGLPAVPSPRLFESEFTVDYAHAFEERPLRWLWVPCAVLLGLLWAMVQWFRRSHVAIYATFDMPAASRLTMQTAEWAVLAVIGVLCGWALGIVGAVALGARAAHALPMVSFHALLTVLGASVLIVLLGLRPTGNLLGALKDR